MTSFLVCTLAHWYGDDPSARERMSSDTWSSAEDLEDEEVENYEN